MNGKMKKIAGMIGSISFLILFMLLLNISKPASIQASSEEARIVSGSGSIGLMSTPAYIEIVSAKENASYYFKPADSKICSMGESRFNNISSPVTCSLEMIGKKYGSTTLDVFEKMNGKEKKLGTYKVSVKKSYVDPDIQLRIGQIVTTQFGELLKYPSSLETYEITSSQPDVVSLYNERSLDPISNNFDYYTTLSIKGQKEGSSNVVVSITKNGKKSTLGTSKVTVGQESISKSSLSMTVGDTLHSSNIIDFYNNLNSHTLISSNENVISVEGERFTALKEGSSVLTIRANGLEGEKELGKVTVTVKPKPICSPTDTKNLTLGKNEFSKDLLSIMLLNSSAEQGKITFKAVSNNPKAVKITYVKDNYYRTNIPLLTPVNTGKAKVTLKYTYKGKTYTLGALNVTIVNKKAQLANTNVTLFIRQENSYLGPDFIKYRDKNATYQVTSSNPKILKVISNHLTGEFSPYFKLLKKGNVTLTIKETRNGKTRTLGKVKVTITNDDYTR